jgi:Domain of unknown function (DUF4149)
MIALRYAYVLALVVWVGGLVTAGAFVAPTLFGVLEAEAGPEGRRLAGAAFGEVLRRVLVAGESAGLVMLVAMTALRLLGPKPLSYGVRAGLLGLMLAGTAYTAHIVLPEAEALRRELDAPIAQVATDDARRIRFDALHLLSTRLVTAVAIAGIVIAAWEARE